MKFHRNKTKETFSLEEFRQFLKVQEVFHKVKPEDAADYLRRAEEGESPIKVRGREFNIVKSQSNVHSRFLAEEMVRKFRK